MQFLRFVSRQHVGETPKMMSLSRPSPSEIGSVPLRWRVAGGGLTSHLHLTRYFLVPHTSRAEQKIHCTNTLYNNTSNFTSQSWGGRRSKSKPLCTRTMALPVLQWWPLLQKHAKFEESAVASKICPQCPLIYYWRYVAAKIRNESHPQDRFSCRYSITCIPGIF